ncbi:hypothetical protein EV217_0392 [Phyllobacterium myrsinacearum]|uniref:hypothetical protein n=1 Tax=Phyllobacterium myrsinacearum TaxID=28101 RepID=UPI001029058F|nr:hypothetical protein [Phyllobacterium myrsinacearum]RZS88014.1 hypothetical protein EV217_0392 [Phyllobacterium myrsinacearum]
MNPKLIWGVLAAAILVWFYFFKEVLHADSRLCSVSDITPNIENTLAYLNGVVDLSMTIASALVGLGAALLLGIQGNVRLTPWRLTFISLSMACFTQAFWYGIWWKLRMADVMINGCWNKLTSALIQQPYVTHLGFMVAGVIFLAALIIPIGLERIKRKDTRRIGRGRQ